MTANHRVGLATNVWKRLWASRRRELCAAVAFAISFVTPLLFLVGVEASAVACGPNCGNLYAGQVTHSTGYTGVRGYIAWPSITLTSPSNDGIVHWLGLTQITDQSQVSNGFSSDPGTVSEVAALGPRRSTTTVSFNLGATVAASRLTGQQRVPPDVST